MSRGSMFYCFVGVVGAAFALLAGGVGEARAGGEVHEDRKLTASDAGAGDDFGVSVSVSGETAAVGATHDEPGSRGSAYVFWLGLTPTESYPPRDSIDARQPSDLACTELFGWDSIYIIFDGDAVGVRAWDFTVTVDPADMSPPGILNLVSSGNTARLKFDMRIPLSHWTIITHDASGFTTRIGALPADVNGDRRSGRLDILDLIDFLNDVRPELEIWQTDIDRNGEADPADILTEIDLFNGAGCFDQWNGTTLPE